MAQDPLNLRFEAGEVSLDLTVPPSVYAPSDDTELLAEAALERALAHTSILEIGTGSGAVILSLAKSGTRFSSLTALDLSPDALAAAQANMEANGIHTIQFLRSDLFSALPPSARFDLLLFNPPYLPTSKAEKVTGALNSALDGGRDGLKTVRAFLSQAKRHLAPHGRILLVVSSLQPHEKLDPMLEKDGFIARPLRSKRFFFETLEVWELSIRS